MLSINISELIWGIVNFLLLYFLLKRFLYTPLIGFMDKRSQRINEGLEAERQALEAKAQAEEHVRTAMEDELARSRQLLSEAGVENAQRLRVRMEQAQQEAGARQREFDDSIDQFLHEKRGELSAHKAELAALLADKLLQD